MCYHYRCAYGGLALDRRYACVSSGRSLDLDEEREHRENEMGLAWYVVEFDFFRTYKKRDSAETLMGDVEMAGKTGEKRYEEPKD